MITLEQVRLLEEKVENAVLKIAGLTAENADLRRTLTEISVQNSDFAKKNANLLELLSKNEENQERIEKGILNALYRLNDIESTVLNQTSAATQAVAEPSVTDEQTVTNQHTVETSTNTESLLENQEQTDSLTNEYATSHENTETVSKQEDFKSEHESSYIETSDEDDDNNPYGQQNSPSEGQIDIF